MKSAQISWNLSNLFKIYEIFSLELRNFAWKNETVAWKWNFILSWVGGPVILFTKHTSLIIHPTYPNPIELLYTPKKHPIKEKGPLTHKKYNLESLENAPRLAIRLLSFEVGETGA